MKSIWLDCTWQIEDPNLQSYFFAVLKEVIIIIIFSRIVNKSVTKVKQTISPLLFRQQSINMSSHNLCGEGVSSLISPVNG